MKRMEAFEGMVNLVPEIVSSDADVASWDERYLGKQAVPHQDGPSRRPRPINPLPRARAHTRRTAQSGLAGVVEQRTSEPLQDIDR